MSSLRNRTTPGVYLTELPAFPPSIVGVATAVPIFIGYTDFARDPVSFKQVYMQAVELTSMADYYSYFGYAYDVQYAVTDSTADANFDFEAAKPDGTGVGYYAVSPTTTGHFNLFTAVKLFYANGGGICYVVSVANYGGQKSTAPFTGTPVSVDKQALLDGLAVAQDKVGPTMVLVPDACLLPYDAAKKVATDYSEVVCAMVNQAATLQDRVAILDLPGATDPSTWTKDGLAAQQDTFYGAIAPASANFSYGTAYAPALQTNVLSVSDVDYTNLQGTPAAGTNQLEGLLKQQNADLYTKDSAKYKQVDTKLTEAFPTTPPAVPLTPAEIQALDQYLCNALPLLQQVEEILVHKLNAAPASGPMAGIWTSNDANRGVWNAPANMSMLSVIAPEVLVTDAEQGDYNVPLNGNAINILRAFTNRGTVVWGARTLDGNSNDYRYIQVRRTLVYIEQSIKTALQPFVFAANDGQTWVTVTGMISNFLTGLWTQGGLMGDKASDAFSVQCGLGSTMTGQDILNGYMVVAVTLQMVHPAEFIELTFTQKMQGV
ncbi:MAG: phage tail sheath subtilisin-like domain-containing protein [Azospirillaceae bacterium]|nr:phage tail sheath subtilisin-like domain-containing protein [Azospirillaceae bacterium]